MILILTIFLVFAISGALGVRYGKEIAVDQSKKTGFFLAYGKKYKAIEVKE